MKFAIVICTRKRPKMLTTCVSSIHSLIIPPKCDIHLVIIENNEKPECESLIKNLMKSASHINYTYKLEKKPGLSTVRNTSLDVAIKFNPDWICFLDDDQFVERDWLTSYHNIIQTNSADVYCGKVNYVLPENIQLENLPIWFKFPFTQFEYPDLLVLDSAGAGNTTAKASYFNGRPYKYRFNEKFRYTGGEDFELFKRINDSGGVIRYVKNAKVNEVVAMERISIRWMIMKEFSNGNLTGYGRSIKYGDWSTTIYWYKTLYLIIEAFKRSFSGTFYLLWGVVIWPFSKRAIRYIVKGIAKIFWAIGLFLGIARIRYSLYKNTEGN